MATAPSTSVTADEVARRTIRRADLVAAENSFIDCRTPGSERKLNYAIIGSGVSEGEQFVNLTIPHGFQLGGASMPPGVNNSLHMHFTAEVFIVASGTYVFRWGRDSIDGELIGHPGDIISMPTWVFRGFSNVGGDDNFIFTILGRDHTGGLIWEPDVLRQAEGHGLLLTTDNRLIDTVVGGVRDRARRAGAPDRTRARRGDAPLDRRRHAPAGVDRGRPGAPRRRAAVHGGRRRPRPPRAGDRLRHVGASSPRTSYPQPARVRRCGGARLGR